MTLVKWRPASSSLWPELSRTWEPLDNLFNSWLPSGRDPGFRVDLSDKEDHYLVSAELPGVKQNDLNVTVENDTLTVTAEKRDEHESKENGIYRRERCYGKLSRSFDLGGNVDVEKIEADLKDGVLTVKLPKKAELKAREVKVDVKVK